MQIEQPVVFLPGTHCDERIWLLTWKKCPVMQRAYVPLQWANTLDEMLALTDDRISGVDSKVHLVGYSMGGYIAALAALASPAKVASLTLVCYSPAGLPGQELQQRQQLLTAIRNKRFPGWSDAMLDTYLAPPQRHNEEIIGTLKAMQQDLGDATLTAQINATTPRKDLTRPLSTAPFPLNLIGAEYDHLAPVPALKDFATQSANSHLHEVKDVAHMLPLENPGALADALSAFLSR